MNESIYHKIQDAINDANRTTEYASLSGANIIGLSEYKKLESDAAAKLESEIGYFDEEEFEKIFIGKDVIPSPYDELIEVLQDAIHQCNFLKSHMHAWVVDESTDRCYCSVCGADGDA